MKVLYIPKAESVYRVAKTLRCIVGRGKVEQLAGVLGKVVLARAI